MEIFRNWKSSENPQYLLFAIFKVLSTGKVTHIVFKLSEGMDRDYAKQLKSEKTINIISRGYQVGMKIIQTKLLKTR